MSNVERGAFTYEETSSVLETIYLIIPSNEYTPIGDTFDSIEQIINQLLKEDVNMNQIFISATNFYATLNLKHAKN